MKLLSIDLDYLMDTCIALYDDISVDAPREMVWDRIRDIRRIEPHLSYNEEAYSKLIGLLVRVLKANPNLKIQVAYNHDNILEMIENYCTQDIKLDIVNFDNHHDVYYEDWHVADLSNDVVSVATWVGFLSKHDMLNSYHWINTHCSQPYTGAEVDFDFKMTTHDVYQVLNSDFEYDMLFICLSPQWFPPKFDNLFDNILELINCYTEVRHRVHRQFYCTDKKPRKLKLRDEN